MAKPILSGMPKRDEIGVLLVSGLLLLLLWLAVPLAPAAEQFVFGPPPCYWSGGIPNAEGSLPPPPSPTLDCPSYR